MSTLTKIETAAKTTYRVEGETILGYVVKIHTTRWDAFGPDMKLVAEKCKNRKVAIQALQQEPEEPAPFEAGPEAPAPEVTEEAPAPEAPAPAPTPAPEAPTPAEEPAQDDRPVAVATPEGRYNADQEAILSAFVAAISALDPEAPESQPIADRLTKKYLRDMNRAQNPQTRASAPTGKLKSWEAALICADQGFLKDKHRCAGLWEAYTGIAGKASTFHAYGTYINQGRAFAKRLGTGPILVDGQLDWTDADAHIAHLHALYASGEAQMFLNDEGAAPKAGHHGQDDVETLPTLQA